MPSWDRGDHLRSLRTVSPRAGQQDQFVFLTGNNHSLQNARAQQARLNSLLSQRVLASQPSSKFAQERRDECTRAIRSGPAILARIIYEIH